jgi:xanthine dehydrogenase accessory factor
VLRDWPLGPNLGQCCGGAVKTLAETFDARDMPLVRQLEDAEKAGAFVADSRVDNDGRVARRIASADKPPDDVQQPFDGRGFWEHFGESPMPVLLFGAGHVGRAVVLALAPLPFTVRWIDGRPDQFPQYVPHNVVTLRTDAVAHELAEAPRDAAIVVMTHSHPLDFDITLAALRRRSFDFVLPESDLERLVCPIGITEIKGKEPAVIAAALAAQLLIVSEQVSTRQPSPAMQPA